MLTRYSKQQIYPAYIKKYGNRRATGSVVQKD